LNMYVAFLLSFLPVFAFATYGVDVSQRVTKSNWQCLKSTYGASFAVVRVYQSGGHTDPNGAANINDARAAGIKYVDGYIFPCYSCGNPAGQMDATINSLKSSGVYLLKEGETHEQIMSKNNHTMLATAEDGTEKEVAVTATAGMLWMDIEGTQYWSSSQTNNVNFIDQLIAEGVKKGISIGVYTSNSQWSPITGGSTKFAKYPLWYAHYDDWASFGDFKAFGGWSKPNVKQYAGTTSQCSVGVDKNFY